MQGLTRGMVSVFGLAARAGAVGYGALDPGLRRHEGVRV